MTKKGERIGAVLKANSETVHLIGYGVYVGDETPPEAVGGFNIGFPNPKLQLDDGTVVWGCECWWGPEDKIRAMHEGKTVVQVDMAAERAAS